MHRMNRLIGLFFSMFKIGLFTFGGGYAMIHLLDAEFVDRRRWIDSEEFMDLVVLAESTPGPIAINCATYIGYKTGKTLGALVATLGMCLPSFSIIYLISLFFNRFLSISWVASAFRGIQMCVVFLLVSAGFKMLKKIPKKPFHMTVMLITFSSMIVFSLLSVRFSTIFYILIFGSIGCLLYAIGSIRRGREGNK